MVAKDHSDWERGNPLLPLTGLLFPISNNGSLYAPSHSTYDAGITGNTSKHSALRFELDLGFWVRVRLGLRL